MNFSGLVLDFYDDSNSEVLKSVFPTLEGVPELIKSAQAYTRDQIDCLPDEAFALVMTKEGQVARKFLCTDPGNTALSIEYFMKTGHKLPAKAQKVAAANLVKAAGWASLEVPEDLQKVAAGLGTLARVGVGTSLIAGGAKETAKNMQRVKAQEGGGGLSLIPSGNVLTVGQITGKGR